MADAFGNTISAAGSKVNELHNWLSSKYLDDETGFYYYGHRYFSPEISRWVSRDPIGERGFAATIIPIENDIADAIGPLEEPQQTVDYLMLKNQPIDYYDILGLDMPKSDCRLGLERCERNADAMYGSCQKRGFVFCNVVCFLGGFKFKCKVVCKAAYELACASEKKNDKAWCKEKSRECGDKCYKPKWRYRLGGSFDDPWEGPPPFSSGPIWE